MAGCGCKYSKVAEQAVLQKYVNIATDKRHHNSLSNTFPWQPYKRLP